MALNRAIHSSTNKSPFEVCFGYLPQSPFYLEFTIESTPQTTREEDDQKKARNFLLSIQRGNYEAPEVEKQLQRTQQKYKARHDRHREQGDFQVGDLVWLHLGKERLKGEGKKLKPIRYGPFNILRKIGENAYQLELPSYMEIYLVVNVENLKPFEPAVNALLVIPSVFA